MDHRISKDMISSGMTPSGEKSQADLGRTQYGSAPTPSSLMDAYKSIYEHHQKDKDGNTVPHEGEELNEGKMPEGLKNYLMKKKGKKEDKKDMKEGVGTVVGGAYGAKKGGVKGAIVGGTAGAMVDSLNKPKKKDQVKTEEVQQVNEILGMAAGAIGAKLAGGAAAKMAAKGAMKTALKKGATSQAARATAMRAGRSAGIKAGANAALNYGTAGSVAGSALKAGSNALSGGTEQKRTMSAGVDLFDIVKGKLLDEGLTEEETLDIMLTLTLEEINETLQLDEISAELLMRASQAADKARSVAAKVGDKALAAKKSAQAGKFYKAGGKKNIASRDLSKPIVPVRKDSPMGRGGSYQEKPGM